MADRHGKNVSNTIPYPYIFEKNAYQGLETDAPILIVGDRLGARLGSFAKIMADKVSENLSKPIQIESMATKGEGLHRTLEKIKSLRRPPLILIYLGGSEEGKEKTFLLKDIPRILKNMSWYEDERIQTLLMIFPKLSRFLYNPVSYQQLGRRPAQSLEDRPEDVIKRNQVNFKLFERQINELFSYTKDRNSYVIAVSTPINLDAQPKTSCPGSFNEQFQPQMEKVMKLLKEKDFKGAYNTSKDLALMANTNARAQYIHGQISKRLGKVDEAKRHLSMAAAYDCSNWRGSPVYNEILRRAASKHDVAFFDLQRMLEDHWGANVVFYDEIYPQNLYMEKMANAIAMKIKKLLKL